MDTLEVPRFSWRWSPLFVGVLLLLFAACNDNPAPATPTSLLGPRAATDSLTAVERYLQQYQPGPLPRVFQTTRLYDRHGTLLAELHDEGDRTWVPLKRISQHLIDATIATEDATFFANNGVDPMRIASALLNNMQSGQILSGASTITMQLARNLFLGPGQRYDQSLDRKLLEAGLAQELTTLYSKDELLEMYLNLLNYGNLAYGPEAAAQRYFGKPAADLSLAEASLLAGIPQQPAQLDPIQNLEAAKVRQRVVLDLMVRHGYLTATAADVIYAQHLAIQPPHEVEPPLAPHFVQYVEDQLDQQLGAAYVRRAGFNITTTLDLPMQQLAQTTVTQKVAQLQPQFDLSNAALVALRPNSGEILAMVGSANFANAEIAGQVNVAVSRRQPGSAIKPVLYATALDANLISPASVLWDIPVTYTISAGQVYAPHNYDNKFHGPVTVRTALANSYNVPTVKLLAGVGIETMLDRARRMGLHSLDQPGNWYGLSLTLGGGEVTLLDLATAYHTLDSGGLYYSPNAVLAINDSQGQVVDVGAHRPPQLVLKPDTAFLITDILSDNEARTPAFGPDSLLKLSQPAAAKTGTTTDFRDNWTVGYTRYLVAGVWAGNSDGRPMHQASGVTGAAPIWHDFMQAVLDDPTLLASLQASADPQSWQFLPPSTVAQRSGCPPGVRCRKDGEYFSQGWLTQTQQVRAKDVGPLADSIERVASAPVYVKQGEQTRRVGFCSIVGAAERTLLKLPTGLLPSVGMTTTVTETATEHSENSASLVDAPTVNAAPTNAETQQVLAWSLRYGAPVNLGSCDTLNARLPAALAQAGAGELHVLVDLAAAANPEVGETASAGAVEITAITPANLQPGVAGLGRYTLVLPVTHDANCPGQYIMGRVIDRTGTPLAGVHIKLSDPWGNQADAVSKNGASDFGMFDFPLPASSPQELHLWVVDEAGNPLSPVFPLQHMQGEAQNAPCHHVVLQGK